jgi:hypothetical protein
MNRLAAVIIVFAVAGVIALLVQRRRPAAPTQPTHYAVPTQLDRADFVRPDAPWLVALFTSSTCDSCHRVIDKARVLEASDVAFQEISYQTDRALHERYSVEAVPLLVIADSDGVVAKSFVGEVTAIDLWGAVATVRDPSSAPAPPDEHDHSP